MSLLVYLLLLEVKSLLKEILSSFVFAISKIIFNNILINVSQYPFFMKIVKKGYYY